MKLQVIVAAMALVIGTSAFADITSVTTTTKTTHHAKSGWHHHHKHHGKHHRHNGKHHHHHGKQVVTKTVVHEEISPPGSVTDIK